MTELAEVIWAVQMSTVEFHPVELAGAPTSRSPTSGGSTSTRCRTARSTTVRRVAHVVHEVLDELGAVGWPKTSGGKGMHVYVRIEPSYGFRDVRSAALAFAREVERRAGGDGDDDVVAQGPGPGGGVRRLQPERPGPHDGGGLLGARRAGRHRVDADHVGRDRRRRAERLHDGDGPGAVRRARRPARRHRSSGLPRSTSCSSGRRATSAPESPTPPHPTSDACANPSRSPPHAAGRSDARESVRCCRGERDVVRLVALAPRSDRELDGGADLQRRSRRHARMVDEQVNARAPVDEAIAATAIEELDDASGPSR